VTAPRTRVPQNDLTTEPLRVAVLDDYQGVASEFGDWNVLDGIAGDVELRAFRDHVAGVEALVERLAPFDVVVAMRERTALPADVLERLPRLRLLVTTGTRNASIDVAAARRLAIEVCGTRFSPADTAELSWALILASLRRLPEELEATRAGKWQISVGSTVRGKRLGVLGLGRLGRLVAEVGLAFGMDVVAWSENLTDEAAESVGVRRVEKDELLATADVVSIHLVLSKRTVGLLGARELGLMKPTALLVNTSRAPIVDQEALVSALRSGRPARAALDVFEEEPLPMDHPLRTVPEVLLTPHIGYVTEENYRIFFGDVIDDIVLFLSGTPVRRVQHFDGA
jgi:phosphoglycerate dehydrogenase-like enzyme